MFLLPTSGLNISEGKKIGFERRGWKLERGSTAFLPQQKCL